MSWVVVAVAGASALTAGIQIEQSSHARRLAGQERNRVASANAAAEKKLKDREAAERATETEKVKRARKPTSTAAPYNKGGTISTTPLGVTGARSTTRRTLLGE